MIIVPDMRLYIKTELHELNYIFLKFLEKDLYLKERH